MRNLIATVIGLVALIPLSLIGLALLALERTKFAIFGQDEYWSERDQSPVR
jgi:hypothetical protein